MFWKFPNIQLKKGTVLAFKGDSAPFCVCTAAHHGQGDSAPFLKAETVF